ncbi:MAG: YkgJ family cysteine cluster protein [Bryobacteraceae bacterium]
MPLGSPQSSPGFVRVKAGVKSGGQSAEVVLTLPVLPVRPSRLLPALRILTDTAVQAAESAAAERNQTIRCYKGCGACCSQMVPLRRMEARRMAVMVDRMPEPRKSAVLARFAGARRRFAEAGMLHAVENPHQTDGFDWSEFALRYFHTGVPCPFLEEGSCSIYAERPMVCREFLVTSDPAHCTHPEQRGVDRLPVPSIGGAVRKFEREHGPDEDPWVVLIHALDWAAAHPAESGPAVVGADLLADVIAQFDEGAAPGKP